MIGSVPAIITSIRDDQVIITVPPHQPGIFTLMLYKDNDGCARLVLLYLVMFLYFST